MRLLSHTRAAIAICAFAFAAGCGDDTDPKTGSPGVGPPAAADREQQSDGARKGSVGGGGKADDTAEPRRAAGGDTAKAAVNRLDLDGDGEVTEDERAAGPRPRISGGKRQSEEDRPRSGSGDADQHDAYSDDR